MATGYICYENYTYYDVLNLNDEKLKYIYGYTYYHPDRYCGSYCTGYSNNPPEYEEHILKVCPELIKFSDNTSKGIIKGKTVKIIFIPLLYKP